MTSADGSTLRTQADVNKFLYASITEMDGNYVPVSGGEFEGPIFGPSVNNVNVTANDVLTMGSP